MPYRAVIFDLDGTLLDTLHDIGSAANDVLTELDEPTHPIADYRFMVGDGVSMLFQRALPKTQANRELLQECVELFEKHYAVRWRESSCPYPEIPEILDWLCANNIPITVLSNKPHAFTCQCVELLLPQWKFDVVLGQRPDVPRKPDPAGVFDVVSQLNTLRKLSLQPSEIVYVGDTNTDMRTAIAAGCLAVGVTWGFRPEMELRESGAKCIIHHPTEIRKYFG